VDDAPRLQTPPRTVVRLAAVAIVCMGVFGLVRGVMLSRPAGPEEASPLAVLGMSGQAAANAKPAVVLTHDDNWSTLSGPQMVDSSQKPKVEAKVAESDDEDDDSASPAAKAAAVDAMAPDAPDAAPAAPAASSAAAPATAPLPPIGAPKPAVAPPPPQ
jgi:hypothetical protein